VILAALQWVHVEEPLALGGDRGPEACVLKLAQGERQAGGQVPLLPLVQQVPRQAGPGERLV